MDRVPTVILCGGRGTRLQELSQNVPKPMVTIGELPILWHIMRWYAAFDQTEFVLALGWLGEVIRSFVLHHQPMLRDFVERDGQISYLDEPSTGRGWSIACVDTGLDSGTATRLKRAARMTSGNQIMVTYGDGLGDVDIDELLAFHRGHGRLATITAVHPPGRFGEVTLSSAGRVESFVEKPQSSNRLINGGFMVFERRAIEDYLPDDRDVMLEQEPLAALAQDGELMAYRHEGFWEAMDTPSDHTTLEEVWRAGKAPWCK